MIFSELDNVIVLQSISKIFGIPGLRIGFAVANPGLLNKLAQHQLPWSVNSMAQEAVRYITEQPEMVAAFLQKTRIYCENQRQQFYQMLTALPQIKLYPGKAPFILAGLPQDITAEETANHLLKKLILIRNCNNFRGLTHQFIRIPIKGQETNHKVGALLKELIRNRFPKPEEGRSAC